MQSRTKSVFVIASYIMHTLLALFVLVTPALSQAESTIRVKDQPPPGFEDLVRPQTTDVDVYYGGEKIGNTLATYIPESIELLFPKEVAALIPHLLDTNEVAAALSGSLRTNADQVCISEHQRECGVLSPNIAGVIFDESRFHLHVFVNRLQLQPQTITSTKFLPKISLPKYSSVSAFSSSISGEDSESSYTAGANHIFSYGQSRLQSRWDYSDMQNFNLESFSLQNDDAGIAKEAGLYKSDTRFSSFTNDLDIVGARLYGSTNTRTDLDYSQATDIFLFLNTRSQVEVFKDGKLIDGGIYDAGNQQLDTFRLPSGSYPILLRITDSAGTSRDEQYFFVKTATLPPMDQPLHYFEVGLLEKDISDSTLPNISDSELLRLGTAYRLQNNLGASIELLHSKNTDLLQGNIAYFGAGYRLQNSAMFGSDGEWGIQLLGQYRRENFALNLDYRQVESNEDEQIDVRILPSDFSQSNLSASIPLYKGQLTLRTQYNNNLNEESRQSYGLDYRYPLWQRNRYTIEFNLNTFYEEDDYSIQSGLRISKTEPNRFINTQTSYLARKTNNNTEQGPLLGGSVNQSFEDPSFGRITLSGFASEELDRTTAGLRTESASTLGRADVQLEWVDDDSRGEFIRFRGLQNTNLLTDGKQLAFGGDRNANSGILIDLQGQSKNEPFEVFVNGQPRGFTKVGDRTVLPLNAFQTYSISIRSRSNELLNFDEGQRKVTLYPGNVQTLTYDVYPIVVLITRVLLSNGKPASRVRIENAIGYAVTDDDGWLQAEISGNAPLQLTKNGESICNITLPELEIQQSVAFVDKLRCPE